MFRGLYFLCNLRVLCLKGILMEDSHLKNFFLPKMTLKYFIRVAVVAVLAYIVFGHLCIPMRLNGSSMEPIYHDGGVNFCWTPSYWFKNPRRGDVVMVR